MTFTQQSFYKSKQWEAFRRVVIAERTNPEDGLVYCALCGKPIVRKYDLIIDHIQELNDLNVNDANVSLNPDNVRCVHFRCHNKRHERFGFGTGGYVRRPKRVYVVYGPPCGGKSTWVRDVAGPDDLVVDMDSIYEMITVNARYVKPDSIRGAAFAVRDSIYDVIKYRSGRWQDAYVITGGARAGDRARLRARVGADDLIFIDTDKETCLSRVDKRDGAWTGYIEEWFDAYQPDTPVPVGASEIVPD